MALRIMRRQPAFSPNAPSQIHLRRFLLAQGVQSVTLPALGAGLGGLSWPAVRAQIEDALADLPVDVRVYEPLRSASPT